jgi:hypothetical protein
MIAAELIQEARTAGVTLTPLPDGKLKVIGRPRVPVELKAALREHKAEVLALLQAYAPLAEAYRRYWSTPETEPIETFRSLYREIDLLERQVDVETAWRTLEAAARVWYQETGACPFCKRPGVLHLATGTGGSASLKEG